VSGICGINGTGNCCAAACSITSASCGATSCDGTGACVYPAAKTDCGTVCTGSTLTASECDGLGACVADAGVPCANGFSCTDGGSCHTTCTDNKTCAANGFCDTTTGTGCCAIASGSGLKVDNSTGSDSVSCCGIGSAGACQTLTRGMQLVDFANALKAGTLVTLNASIGGVGGDWTKETYPVSLGWGVTLDAPGVYFTDTTVGNPEIFDVALKPGEAAGNPVIIGGASSKAANLVVIGTDSSGNLTTDQISILVEAGQTLDILNAQVLEKATLVGGILCKPWCGMAIEVDKTASVNVSSDNSGNSGTVYLGGTLPNGATPVYGGRPGMTKNPSTGIYCNGTISDGPSGATPSLVSSQESISIDAEDNCSITLNNDPTFGTTTAGGFNGCGKILDDSAIMANGNLATVTLSGATISCMNFDGIDVTNTNDGPNPAVVTIQADDGGNPSVIENCENIGIYTTAGSTYVIGSKIQYNFIGIDMETDNEPGPPPFTTNPDGVWVNDGTGNAPTTNSSVICNSGQEGGFGGVGIDVFNNSTANVNADYVNWDQWYDPNGGATGTTTDIFFYDENGNYSCQVFDSSATAVCVNTTTDDLDLVMGSDGGTAIGTYSINNGASSGSGCQ
jgi:hypothetical protein